MCGRYSLDLDAELAQRIFQAPGDWPDHKRYNIAPSQSAPVVVHDRAGRVCRAMRWGLIPHWAKDPAIGGRLINARSETAASKPAFRDAWRHRRCLVPATGFYEWAKRGRAKQPMSIHRPGSEPLALAGLWARWDGPHDPLETFTILTRCAIPTIAAIHDRMPVLLGESTWDAWLDPDPADPAALARIVDQPPGQLVADPVSTRVNSPANDDPGLIEPIELPGSGAPDGLFE